MNVTVYDPTLKLDEAGWQRELRRRGRDQAATDRESAAEARESAAADRDQTQLRADGGTWDRDQVADGREHAAADRDGQAADRDRHQAYVDESEANTDERTRDRRQAAEDRRSAATDRILTATDRRDAQAAADERTVNRGRSARDREHAAQDRRASLADRVAADGAYEQARAALDRALHDELTGACGRQLGLSILEREINRATDVHGKLVLAYVDVSGLKQVNDLSGHLAGDGLLRDVARAIQTHLRPDDTLVRVGGDEFVCWLVGCTPADARGRFQQVRATIQKTQTHASITVGRLLSEPMIDYITPVGGGYFFVPPAARTSSDWVGSGLFPAA